MEEITRIIREEINYKGTSVIIPRRECMQTLQRHLKEKRKAHPQPLPKGAE
jgi:indolepyruvate ferredoxin oxidoreductase alpha subunit